MKFCNRKTISARMADYTLTVHVQSEETSKIVYVDLSEFSGAEIYLKEKESSYALVIKNAEKPEQVIYVFENRKEALRAMKAVASAMLSSKGFYKGKSGFRRFIWGTFKAAIILLVVIVALSYLLLPSPTASIEDAKAPAAQTQGMQQEKLPEGTPVPLVETVK